MWCIKIYLWYCCVCDYCREANTTKHCTRSKYFARYRYEMRNPETGEEVGQIEFYKLTYGKDGVWKSPKAEENMGKCLNFMMHLHQKVQLKLNMRESIRCDIWVYQRPGSWV